MRGSVKGCEEVGESSHVLSPGAADALDLPDGTAALAFRVAVESARAGVGFQGITKKKLYRVAQLLLALMKLES